MDNNKLDKLLDVILIAVILFVLILFVTIIIVGHSHPYSRFFDSVQGVGLIAKNLLIL